MHALARSVTVVCSRDFLLVDVSVWTIQVDKYHMDAYVCVHVCTGIR